MARLFNGTTDRIDYRAFDTTGKPITVMGFVLFDTATPAARQFFWGANHGTGVGTALGRDTTGSGNLVFLRSCNSVTRAVTSNNSVVATATWHHIAAVDTGLLTTGQTKLYVDGSEVGIAVDTAGSGGELTVNSLMSIGGRIADHARDFPGQLGSLSVHLRTLTAGEIMSHAKRRPASDNPAGLVFDVDFNKGVFRDRISGGGALVGGTSYVRHPLSEVRKIGKPSAKIFTFSPPDAAAGVTYPQLERNHVRGLLRGVAR